MLWTTVLWLLKALVVLWALELVVFAVGISFFRKAPKTSQPTAEAKRAARDEAITEVDLESPLSETG